MPVTLALAAMATRFELLLPGRDEPALRAAGEAALAAIADVERRLSRFRADSLVAWIERREGAALPWDEMVLLEVCRRVQACTDGAFDPCAPFSAWRIDRRARRVAAPAGAGRLDFGGVGKGHALDLAVRALRDAGVTSALLHGGTSSVAALGTAPDGRPWRVALRHPAAAAGTDATLATVELRDVALSVSAPHGRTRKVDGRRVGHIVDPKDGRPVARARLAAVVARHGTVAEVWSTALLVLVERALRAGGSRAAAREAVAALAPVVPPSIDALVVFDPAFDAGLDPCADPAAAAPVHIVPLEIHRFGPRAERRFGPPARTAVPVPGYEESIP